MQYTSSARQRLRQQKINELRHQLRYTNTAQERDYIAMQIDAIRRHG